VAWECDPKDQKVNYGTIHSTVTLSYRIRLGAQGHR